MVQSAQTAVALGLCIQARNARSSVRQRSEVGEAHLLIMVTEISQAACAADDGGGRARRSRAGAQRRGGVGVGAGVRRVQARQARRARLPRAGGRRGRLLAARTLPPRPRTDDRAAARTLGGRAGGSRGRDAGAQANGRARASAPALTGEVTKSVSQLLASATFWPAYSARMTRSTSSPVYPAIAPRCDAGRPHAGGSRSALCCEPLFSNSAVSTPRRVQ